MKKSTRVISLILSVVMLVGLMPLMTISSTAYDNTIRFNSNGKFKIMQISDIQDDEEVDDTTLSLISKAVQSFEPDLVVLTGDNVTTKMTESKFKQSVNQFMAPIIASGARYAVTFGNHDSEGNLLNKAYERNLQYQYYCSLSNLAVDFNVPSTNDSTHVASGAIPIYDSTGSRVKFCVVPLDTGDYDSNGDYDGINAATVSYLRTLDGELPALNANNPVPTMVFQHIPMQEIYTTAIQACSSSESDIKGTGAWSSNYYKLGLPGTTVISGEMKEGPCPNAIDNNEYETLLSATGMDVVGVFYGHDHKNSFVVEDTNGLVQGYCKASTLNAYNDGNPGVRCFTINTDGTYTTEIKTVSDINTEGDHTYTHDDVTGAPSVPPVLYVGDASNSITKQEFGSTIQTQLLNHKTQAMYNADLTITFDVNKNATTPVLTPDSGVTVAYQGATVGSTTTRHTWKVTGGAAEVGQTVQFKFDYSISGTAYTQYAYSYVDNIKSPAGHYFWNRNYRGGDSTSHYCTQYCVTTLLGDTVYGRARAQTDSVLHNDHENKDVEYWTDATAGYYNYTSHDDDGFVKKDNTAYGLNYCSPRRQKLMSQYPRFMAAGTSPRADIFIDTSTVSTLADADISINFYRTDTTDHNLASKETTAFHTGDYGYTTSTWNTNTTNALTVSNNGANLAATAKSNLNQKLSGSIPANGSSFTAITDSYMQWNGGDYDTDQDTYTPIYMVFTTYTKGDLRTLLNSERALARQEGDYSAAAFTRYSAAMREAWLQVNKVNTNQAAIDAAYEALNTAVNRIDETTEISLPSNEAYSSTSSVPSRIYVAGAEYGTSKQPVGTTIVTNLVNLKTGNLTGDYTTFSLTGLPANATTPTCEVTCSDGTVQYSWNAATMSGKITGGTANVGARITYKFQYIVAGKTYTKYAASIVASAPGASGWVDYIRKKSGALFWEKKASQEILAFVASAGVPADGFGFAQQTATTASNGGANYSVCLTNFNGSGSQKVSGVGIGDWTEPGNADEGTWFCGSSGHDASDQNHRAKFTLYVDSALITKTSQMNLFYRAIQVGNQDDTAATTENTGYRWLVSGAKTVTTSASTSNISTSYMAFGSMSGTLTTTAGSGYTADLSGSSLIPAGTYTMATKYETRGDKDLDTYYIWEFYVQTSNKSSLRALVNQEDALFRQQADGYTASTFQTYINALIAAKAVLANPQATTANATTAYNTLNNAINNLGYVKADYSLLKAKLAEIFVVNSNGIPIEQSDGLYHYRPYPLNDPTYYSRNEYYPRTYFRSTNEVDVPYDSFVRDIGWNADIRYQATIDSYCDVLDVGWESVYLNNADYSVVDTYLGYKTGLGANNALGGAKIRLNPEKYNLPEAREYIDYTYYTTETYQDWTDACEPATINRSFKMPDQSIVDGYANALEVTYTALELAYADYSELDAVIADVYENVGLTVEVKCPGEPGRNYNIAYYSIDVVEAFDDLIALYNSELYALQQDVVDELKDAIFALYSSLGSEGTLNDADYSFLDEQVNIEAEYESDYEKYYTTESWEAYTDLRTEYSAYSYLGGFTTADQESTINAAAQAIYDARNNLRFNPADYSEVNYWLNRASALDPNNYTNWSVLQTAINAVVKGKLVTEQAEVDTMAADLETAYNGLTLKDADYSALNTAIATANQKLENEDLYTPGSVTNLRNALAAANTVKNHTPVYNILEQTIVDERTTALNNAINALEYKAADIAPLEEALGAYYSLNTWDYEEEYGTNILNAVNTAAEAALALMTSYNNGELDIRNNAEIASTAQALTDAIADLPALYQGLTIAKEEIPSDLTLYTDESVAALNNYLATINYNLKIADQDTVYEYADQVYTLIDALELKDANLTELITQINRGIATIGDTDPSAYTAASYNAYAEAYNAAVDIRDADPAYKIDQQEEVNEAVAALSAAINGLTLRDADYTYLNAYIAEADALDMDAYTAESITASDIAAALAAAKAVPAGKKADEQPVIDAAAAALRTAIDALVLKPQNVELVPQDGSPIQIDNDTGFIYGLTDRENGDITDVLDAFAELQGAEGYIVYEYSNEDNVIGTGTVAKVYRKSDDQLIKTYTFIIFGDNNGDGYINISDTIDFAYYEAYLNCSYDYEMDYDVCANVRAMDVDGDGAVTGNDMLIIAYYDAWIIDAIDQSGVGTTAVI